MPLPRLVATDIDGTLINDQRELSLRTVRALQAVARQGVPVVLVTGLNPWAVRPYLELLGPELTAICLNGVFRWEKGQLHAGQFIAPAVAHEAARTMSAQGYAPQVYGADGVCRYWPVSATALAVFQAVIARRPYQPYQAVTGLPALFAAPPAQVAVCDTAARGELLYRQLAAQLDGRAYVTFSLGHETWVEVNHPEARKDTALLAYAQQLGVAPEQILYFGDNYNDLVVFRAVGYPVAVANAQPELQALAWRLAPSNNEEGVARLLEELFVLGEDTARSCRGSVPCLSSDK